MNDHKVKFLRHDLPVMCPAKGSRNRRGASEEKVTKQLWGQPSKSDKGQGVFAYLLRMRSFLNQPAKQVKA